MTPEQIKTKLEGLKQEAEQALTESSRKEGQLDEVKSTLQKDFEIETLEQAQDELAQIDEEIKSIEKEIQQDYDNLTKEFGLE